MTPDPHEITSVNVKRGHTESPSLVVTVNFADGEYRVLIMHDRLDHPDGATGPCCGGLVLRGREDS